MSAGNGQANTLPRVRYGDAQADFEHEMRVRRVARAIRRSQREPSGAFYSVRVRWKITDWWCNRCGTPLTEADIPAWFETPLLICTDCGARYTTERENSQ